MRRRRDVRRERGFGIRAVERQACLDPLSKQRHLLRRQRVAFQGHTLFYVRRDNSAEGFASVEIVLNKSRLRRVASGRHSLERVDAITAFGLLGPVASQAVAQQEGRYVAFEADVVCLGDIYRD